MSRSRSTYLAASGNAVRSAAPGDTVPLTVRRDPVETARLEGLSA